MSLDQAKKEDELLTKVLREPFEYNTPTVDTSGVENESQTSHYHPQFNEKDYLSKYKVQSYRLLEFLSVFDSVQCLGKFGRCFGARNKAIIIITMLPVVLIMIFKI